MTVSKSKPTAAPAIGMDAVVKAVGQAITDPHYLLRQGKRPGARRKYQRSYGNFSNLGGGR